MLGCLVRPPTDLAANTERQDPENVTASRRTLLSDRYVRALCDDDAAGHWQAIGGHCRVAYLSCTSFLENPQTMVHVAGTADGWDLAKRAHRVLGTTACACARVCAHPRTRPLLWYASKARTRTASLHPELSYQGFRSRSGMPSKKSKKSANGRLLRDRPSLGWAACPFVPFPGPRRAREPLATYLPDKHIT